MDELLAGLESDLTGEQPALARQGSAIGNLVAASLSPRRSRHEIGTDLAELTNWASETQSISELLRYDLHFTFPSFITNLSSSSIY